ncbi:hypothetical protein ACIGGE_03720 [Qipengyuania sp. NPDC077410]|uniref:hypothetical protein n=1 Tax=Qipengyuania sp. NPDC077410 TaxID=3364496 RepID=UPI0037CAF625
MTLPNLELLRDQSPLFPADGDFRATLEARGLYNSFQFVLRLSPVVHRKIASLPSGITSEVDFEGMQAFSTYLHETIHWWQHIGSTYGFMLSMTYPTQSHSNHGHLKKLIEQVGFKKSILNLAEALPRGGLGTPAGTANIVINNHFDMEVFRGLTVSPHAAKLMIQNPQFENLGHAFTVLWGNNISLLSSVTDRHFNVIPHPKGWSAEFRKLREAREEGYYYGSPIGLPELGAYELFEGQARMSQLHYLHFGTGGKFDMADAVSSGMFKGVYGKAFSGFLTMTGLDWPDSLDHPTVASFLVACDVAINPGAGFPFPVVHFPSFIDDIDPGRRFMTMCKLAREKCPEVFSLVQDYSREEYAETSQKFASTIVEMPPLEIAAEFCRWISTPEFQPIMREYETFSFGEGNTVPRVLFAHFLAFMRDKYAHPEFFCWPGALMAGERLATDAMALFDRHGALFVDKEDDDGIFPRLISGQNEARVQETFDSFFANNVVFNLTRQWITRPGPFDLDFGWLTQGGSPEAVQAYCERTFRSAYGVSLRDVDLLGA